MSLTSETWCALQEFNQQALSNTLWSCAILRHDPGETFLTAAADQIIDRMGEFNAQVNPRPPLLTPPPSQPISAFANIGKGYIVLFGQLAVVHMSLT